MLTVSPTVKLRGLTLTLARHTVAVSRLSTATSRSVAVVMRRRSVRRRLWDRVCEDVQIHAFGCSVEDLGELARSA